MKSSISIEYKKFLNWSIWPIDRNLTGTTTLSQSGPGSNGKDGALHILQISKTETSSSLQN